jgi:hypothetical protein
MRACCFCFPQPTTDFRNGCTDEHGGTSAAAPQASAIFALALEQKYAMLVLGICVCVDAGL